MYSVCSGNWIPSAGAILDEHMEARDPRGADILFLGDSKNEAQAGRNN